MSPSRERVPLDSMPSWWLGEHLPAALVREPDEGYLLFHRWLRRQGYYTEDMRSAGMPKVEDLPMRERILRAMRGRL